MVVNAKVVNVVANRNNRTPNKSPNKTATTPNKQQPKQKPQLDDSMSKETKKTELRHRQRLIECLNDITRDYPYTHTHSLDIWLNECIIDHPPLSQFSFKDKPTTPLASSSSTLLLSSEKISSLSISNVLTSSTFLDLVECPDETEFGEIIDEPDIYKIESNILSRKCINY